MFATSSDEVLIDAAREQMDRLEGFATRLAAVAVAKSSVLDPAVAPNSDGSAPLEDRTSA